MSSKNKEAAKSSEERKDGPGVTADPGARPRDPRLQAIQKAVTERDFETALKLASELITAEPLNSDGWNALGVALRASGRANVALGCYRRALDLRPNDAGVMSNLGNALKDLQRHREAIAIHQRVVAHRPSAASWMNLGVSYHDGGFHADALGAFNEAVRLNPKEASAHFDRAQVLLRLGNYADGWREFEWRWQISERPPMPNYATPIWDGKPLDGALLLWPEQGFGDSILSMRFIPIVKQRVKRVILGCKPEVARLFSAVAGVDEIVQVGKVAPPHAAHAPVMGLAVHVMKSLADLPPPARLHVPDESRNKLAPVIAQGGKRFKVGIIWSGSVTFKGNHHRAVPFERFACFAEIPGVQLYSLQKGPRADELKNSGASPYIIDLGPHLEDFADTAAAVEMLDLVIMTDSSVAHLCGSLGRPVWNLIPFNAYWLYLEGRSDSPWYPSMRLFRQKIAGDWDSVFSEAKNALAELVMRHARR
jgi:Tfp pilus assembly protein PilF